MRLDTLVTGRIATLEGTDGFGWAEAIGIAGGRVVATGTKADLEAEAIAVGRRIDLPPDRIAIPGLSDGHLHLSDLAVSAHELDLADVASLEEGMAAVGARHRALADPTAWLEGHGWDASRWGRWPTADDLAVVAPGRRVLLWSHDHHAVLVSREVLALARVEASTPDPAGGLVRRATDGDPTGVLQETAADLALHLAPGPSPERLAAAIEATAHELLAYGLVAIHDPGEVAADPDLTGGFAAYERLASAGRLPLRVHASVRAESLALAIERGLRSGAPLGGDGDRLRMGWLKLFSDGTLGSRTARMLAPFEREPDREPAVNGGLGIDVTAPAEVAAFVARAAAADIASQIHAIGDAASRTSLDALARVRVEGPLMPRIEHAQLLDPAEIGRFVRDGVAASVMPGDIRSDAVNAWRSWGRRRVEGGAYAYRSLVRSGAVVVFGTDAPVERPDPWPAIATAVTRRSPAWPATTETFVAREALPLDVALRIACTGAPRSAGETDRGRLVRGQRADLAVVPAAALTEPVEPGGPLESTRASLVLIDGVPVLEA